MPENQPTTEAIPANQDYGSPIRWEEGRKRLAGMPSYWLTTLDADGAPHVMPCLAVWYAGNMYFSSKETSRKGRNLSRDARCVLTAGSSEPPALDMVVEGTASRVTDEATLQQVAEVYDKKYGWTVQVRDGRFDAEFGAPTAGAPPYNVYEVTPARIYALPGVASDENAMPAPTRWRFS